MRQRTNSAQFLLQKMTTMQRHSGVQSSLLSDGECFDMWHDYMDLGRLLKRLCNRRDEDHRGPEGPKDSAVTSPVSSLSDTSFSGTPSSSSSYSSSSSSDFCRFCKQNGESPRVYQSHKLKSDDGKVICPILWNYTCPICEATGERAHTRRYCPQLQRQEAARMLPAGSMFW